MSDLGFIGEYHDMDDIAFVPVVKEAQPVVTKTIDLEVLFDTMDDGTNRAMFNQIAYNAPLVPAIFSELSLASNATVAQAYGPSSFVLDPFDVVDLVVKNGDAGKHPL
jgi:iron transport multicopper oxidase